MGIEVISDAVRAEGKKWYGMETSVATPEYTVASLTLSASAFFVGSVDVFAHSQTYEQFRSFMETVLNEGYTEFGYIGDALGRIADAYDRADKAVELDLNKIYHV